MLRRAVEWLEGFLVTALVAAALAGFLTAVTRVAPPRPLPKDFANLRFEPPAEVGAPVMTEWGRGEIERSYKEFTGIRWVIRLDSTGKRVALYRSQFRVLPRE